MLLLYELHVLTVGVVRNHAWQSFTMALRKVRYRCMQNDNDCLNSLEHRTIGQLRYYHASSSNAVSFEQTVFGFNENKLYKLQKSNKNTHSVWDAKTIIHGLCQLVRSTENKNSCHIAKTLKRPLFYSCRSTSWPNASLPSFIDSTLLHQLSDLPYRTLHSISEYLYNMLQTKAAGHDQLYFFSYLPLLHTLSILRYNE